MAETRDLDENTTLDLDADGEPARHHRRARQHPHGRPAAQPWRGSQPDEDFKASPSVLNRPSLETLDPRLPGHRTFRQQRCPGCPCAGSCRWTSWTGARRRLVPLGGVPGHSHRRGRVSRCWRDAGLARRDPGTPRRGCGHAFPLKRRSGLAPHPSGAGQCKPEIAKKPLHVRARRCKGIAGFEGIRVWVSSAHRATLSVAHPGPNPPRPYRRSCPSPSQRRRRTPPPRPPPTSAASPEGL